VGVDRDPDLQVVLACQDPDSEAFEAAFETLFATYRDRVYSIAYRITGSSTDAMDVVQESFSLVFRKVGSFRFDSLFSTWLFRIVVNCSIDYRRSLRGRNQRQSASIHRLDANAEPAAALDAGPADRAAAGELGDHVQRAIARLSPKLRAILVLRYLEGLSYDDLAHALDVSLGTVKSRLARAHIAIERILRGTLGAYGYPETEGSLSEGVA
jgi:RNA polymerase sigma-70 factor (ECF subfamily)